MIFPVAVAYESGRKGQLYIVPVLIEAVSREEAIGIGQELAKNAMPKEKEFKRLHSVHCGNEVVWKSGETVKAVESH